MKAVIFRFFGTMIALPLAAWLLPGVHAAGGQVAWFAGVLLALLFLLLRPLAKLLLSPLNCLTMGLLGFAVDAGFVLIVSRWMPGFTVDGFFWAVVVALITVLLREGLGKIADDMA